MTTPSCVSIVKSKKKGHAAGGREKMAKAEKTRGEKIWSALMKFDLLLWAIIFLFILLFGANLLCTSFLGINFIHFVHGESMYPTMEEGTWVVSKIVPFDELQVGDIITFRERKVVTA